MTEWVTEVDKLLPSVHFYEWMTKPYILSQALKRICHSLTVEVISQEFTNAHSNEYSLLGLTKGDVPFIRQVILLGDGIPFTKGRVVIHPTTYQNHFAQFAALGSQLIGETVLHNNNPDVTRSRFEYAHLEEGWARRSVFWIKKDPLLVSEIFLPILPAYVSA